MEHNFIVQKTIEKMILYFDADVRRINHALKVLGFAQAIAGCEDLTAAEREIVGVAAILHDIGIKEAERKYDSSAGKYQELEGPAVAEKLLKELGAGEQLIGRVTFLIGNHHSYNKIDGIDFQILVEADFLVNHFEDELSTNAARSVRDKYFRTDTGKRLMDSMYLKERIN